MPKTNEKRKRRRRGAQARANAHLTDHIESLGLQTVAQYQYWCREHGFTAALNKSWQDRRVERAAVKRDAKAAAADKAVLAHVKALGLGSTQAYQAWCREQNLSDALHKGDRPRRKELDMVRVLTSQAVLRKVRRITRRPRDTITGIFEGSVPTNDLRPEYMARIAEIAGLLSDQQPVRKAFRDLLLAADRSRADLFDVTTPAITRFGTRTGNTWIDGLAALARRQADWQRSPDYWRPERHNPRRQFGSLARHLLARYHVPAFFDTAFFLDPTEDALEADRQQTWFIHVGMGANIRTAPDLQVSLTKRMAHEFLRAPRHYSLFEALRYGQIVGQDGSEELVDAVVATRLGESFENEAFWSTFIHWLTLHPMLDPEWIGPIVDYIQDQKFGRQEVIFPGGRIELQDPLQANFSMKSRSADKLLRYVEQWHARLVRDQRVPSSRWQSCGVGELSVTDHDEETDKMLIWSISELTTTHELVAEGKAMHHCVRTYAHTCRRGSKAVFSLQISDENDNSQRLMTIAVNPKSRRVTQARGKYNALPGGRILNRSKNSLDDRYRHYLRRSRSVLHQWEQQEGLVRSFSL